MPLLIRDRASVFNGSIDVVEIVGGFLLDYQEALRFRISEPEDAEDRS
jgi:hypothetical protein